MTSGMQGKMIRLAFVIIFAILIVTLILCGLASWRSNKPIGRSVSLFCLSIIPPILGNMIIIGTATRGVALVGTYIYYIGMDLAMYALIRFTNEYCRVKRDKSTRKEIVPSWIKYLLVMDVIQMLLNIPFGHAFALQEIEAYGRPYFIINPLYGQIFHWIIFYGAMALVMIVYFIMVLFYVGHGI